MAQAICTTMHTTLQSCVLKIWEAQEGREKLQEGILRGHQNHSLVPLQDSSLTGLIQLRNTLMQ